MADVSRTAHSRGLVWSLARPAFARTGADGNAQNCAGRGRFLATACPMRGIAVLLVVLVPQQALAHGGMPGGGGFFSGAMHPLLAIEHLLALCALGLLLTRHSGPFARSPLLALALGVAAGLAMQTPTGPVILLLALVAAGVQAAVRQVPLWVTAGLAGLTGWSVGADTDALPPVLPDVDAAFAFPAGVFAGVFLIVLNTAALSMLVPGPGLQMARRVAGSWVAVIALTLLALRLRAMVMS